VGWNAMTASLALTSDKDPAISQEPPVHSIAAEVYTGIMPILPTSVAPETDTVTLKVSPLLTSDAEADREAEPVAALVQIISSAQTTVIAKAILKTFFILSLLEMEFAHTKVVVGPMKSKKFDMHLHNIYIIYIHV
jgi:hypothetical protein